MACVYEHRPVIQFLKIPDGDSGTAVVDKETACMALLLVHEIVHTLGIDDVYEDPEHVKNDESCIMRGLYEENAIAVYTEIINDISNNNFDGNTSSPLFCSLCHEKVSTYTFDKVIPGNVGGE